MHACMHAHVCMCTRMHACARECARDAALHTGGRRPGRRSMEHAEALYCTKAARTTVGKPSFTMHDACVHASCIITPRRPGFSSTCTCLCSALL